MSDDIVVVDNGSTYETQESAIVAKNEADRAEQWAKYSEEKANLADERAVDAAESSDAAAQAATAAIEAKQYAETAITDENLIIVATDLKSTPSNIKKTAGSIDNVNTVGNDIENINAVAANKANIDKVAADKDNIDTVATNIVNVNTVAKNIDNVNLLAPHTEAMEALAPDIMDVVTVAGITEQTKNVSENMAHVVAVDNNKANIDRAVANATNITTVATSINNVNAVAGNKANIDSVAANKTNINNVSANITAVNNVSENMVDVKAAVQSANDAKLWAVGTITEKPEGSSKYWAEQAQQAAQVYDASETVKGILRLATSEEAESGLDDTTAITPLKLKQNIVDNVGRVNQLGFNGTLESGVITFTPDQGTYELKAGYEYEIDLLFSAVGIIPDDTQLKIVNGTDTINIVNVLDSDYSKPTTYKAMKQVCRYDTEIGWRWIFNVRYSVASDGSKVFVMPSTATNVDTTDIYNKIDTKQDISTAVNYNNISNCITEIPQDIKLELNNGTLTLKAGSKVYIPNGFETSIEPLYAWPVNSNEIYYTESETPTVGDKTYNEKGIYTYYKVHDVSGTTLVLQKGKDSDQVVNQVTVTRDTSKDTYYSKPDTTKPKFDVVTIDSDLSIPKWNNTVPGLISITSNRETWVALMEQQYSGISAPTSQYALWYDTTNNKIKSSSNAGPTWKEGYCLPIAICTANSSKWTSIDQVFNGFGYIGSTVYALPGVKGLIPNGRNADGSLKSTEFTLDKVFIFTVPPEYGNPTYFGIGNDFPQQAHYVGEKISADTIKALGNVMIYDDESNKVISTGDGGKTFYTQRAFYAFKITHNNGKVSSLTPKTAFHALDYNDKSTISGWSMPSNRYIDLTLGASGTTYTAPANGCFTWYARNKNNGQFFIQNNSSGLISYRTFQTEHDMSGFIPAKAGDTIHLEYYNLTFNVFRFIYAEGELYNPSSSSKNHSYIITTDQDDSGGAS